MLIPQEKTMYKVRYTVLLALWLLSLLSFTACHREDEPVGATRGSQVQVPEGDPATNVTMSVNFGSPDLSNPLEALDGIAPEPGTNPVIYIAVQDVATSAIQFERMVEFKQNTTVPYRYDSQEPIPLYGGKKYVYALYYPNLAGRHIASDAIRYFRPNASNIKSEGVQLPFTFVAAINPNVVSPTLTDFYAKGSSPQYDKYAAFPIVLHKSREAHHDLVALPHAAYKYQNTPADAYEAWANDNDGKAPLWRYDTDDYHAHKCRTGQNHGTIAPDAAVSFNETKKIQIGTYAQMLALCDPSKPLAENYNYNGVYKLPHNALASGRTTLDVDALMAAHPTEDSFDVDIVLRRDYARVRVFIAKDKDKPINAGDPSSAMQKIGLRGIGFIAMPSVAAPSFRANDTDRSELLRSVAYNPAGARSYNDAYAVEFASGPLKYPELKAAPTGSDDYVCNYMRQHPEDYMYLLPQYIGAFAAPATREYAFPDAEKSGLLAPNFSPNVFTSAYSRYKDLYNYRNGNYDKMPYIPRILVATYYADRDTSPYLASKDLNDPIWTHWVPFGEALEGISTADTNTETNPEIRSLYSGDILPGHNYDVFIIVPTPTPGSSVTAKIKVIVKSWNERSIVIPDFE